MVKFKPLVLLQLNQPVNRTEEDDDDDDDDDDDEDDDDDDGSQHKFQLMILPGR